MKANVKLFFLLDIYFFLRYNGFYFSWSIMKKRHYIDNEEFYNAIKQWRENYIEAKDQGVETPPIPEYLGECFLKIATHLSYRPNFINYTYKDEMILDGIENCIQYAHNFNHEKYSNPFGYFTQIVFYAFVRRIQKEKKQQHIKHKIIENINFDPSIIGIEDNEDLSNYYADYLQKNFLPEEEVYKTKKRKVDKPKGLEKFCKA